MKILENFSEIPTGRFFEINDARVFISVKFRGTFLEQFIETSQNLFEISVYKFFVFFVNCKCRRHCNSEMFRITWKSSFSIKLKIHTFLQLIHLSAFFRFLGPHKSIFGPAKNCRKSWKLCRVAERKFLSLRNVHDRDFFL